MAVVKNSVVKFCLQEIPPFGRNDVSCERFLTPLRCVRNNRRLRLAAVWVERRLCRRSTHTCPHNVKGHSDRREESPEGRSAVLYWNTRSNGYCREESLRHFFLFDYPDLAQVSDLFQKRGKFITLFF
jgi:hypothetical protein